MKTLELITKYPKIFQQYEGNPGMVNWLGLPETWIPIVDKLCGAIQDYIDNWSTSALNPEYVEGTPWNKEDIKSHKYIPVHHPQVTCVQMKEKFGGLRFYTNSHNDVIDGMIKMAEYMCENICIECGGEEELGYTTGWITVCCKKCAGSKVEIGGWNPKSE